MTRTIAFIFWLLAALVSLAGTLLLYVVAVAAIAVLGYGVAVALTTGF